MKKYIYIYIYIIIIYTTCIVGRHKRGHGSVNKNVKVKASKRRSHKDVGQ